MRVFLDTTYLLPVVGIEVNLPEDLLEKLFSSNHSFIINELSLFELLGKASRFFSIKKEAKDRFNTGMKSILSSKIDIKPIFTLDTLSMVLDINEKIKDLPDCPITATALTYSDVMLTEAADIPKAVDFEILNLKIFANKYL
jgi:predicted nucleic acid-binding protein